MILDAVHSLTTGVIVLLAIAFFLGFVFGFAIRSYISLGACATNRPAAPLIWCVRIGGARRAPLGHSKLPRPRPHEFLFVQTAFNIAMLPSPEGGKHTWRKHDDEVNCCRRLSRGRRNFGARDNSGADSSAGRHALASSLGVRPV